MEIEKYQNGRRYVTWQVFGLATSVLIIVLGGLFWMTNRVQIIAQDNRVEIRALQENLGNIAEDVREIRDLIKEAIK